MARASFCLAGLLASRNDKACFIFLTNIFCSYSPSLNKKSETVPKNRPGELHIHVMSITYSTIYTHFGTSTLTGQAMCEGVLISP